MLLSVSLTARSFKEAQSMISPLNIAVIMPAAIGLIPGDHAELQDWRSSRCSTCRSPPRSIIAGTIQPGHLAVVYVSLITLAILSLWGSAWWFGRESTIFRS